jgi:hypothetical protein
MGDTDSQGLCWAVVVRILINGKEAGVVAWNPRRIDITGFLRSGRNSVVVELTSSLRNLLGPHHFKGPEPTVVCPESFSDEKKWSDTYRFVPFGLGTGVRIEAWLSH